MSDHWTSFAAVATGLAAWFAANVLGKPLTTFWNDRARALQAIEEYSRVTMSSSEKRIDEALTALRNASANLAAHGRAKGLAVRIYCGLRRYDLAMASKLIRGICVSIVDGDTVNETRLNTVDLACLLLGATGTMDASRQAELRKLLADHIATSKSQGSSPVRD